MRRALGILFLTCLMLGAVRSASAQNTSTQDRISDPIQMSQGSCCMDTILSSSRFADATMKKPPPGHCTLPGGGTQPERIGKTGMPWVPDFLIFFLRILYRRRKYGKIN